MKWLLILGLIVVDAVAQPMLPLPRIGVRPNTNGAVMLTWTYGVPRWNSLSNITLGTSVDSGVFNTYLVSGLVVGSTNAFVAFNAAGASNVETGIAQPFVLKASIRPYTYLVTVPTSTNAATRILTSTDLKVWNTFRLITNSEPTYQFVWTNDNGTRFFHSVSP